VAEIAETAVVNRAAVRDVAGKRAPIAAASPGQDAVVPLTDVDVEQWRALAGRAIEPNGYYLPGWELAVNALASGRTNVFALEAWSDAVQHDVPRLIGLMPVVPMSRAYKIPLPALASAHPYGTLCTPPLDREMASDAVALMMQAARNAGVRALILRDISLDGPAMNVFGEVLRQQHLRPRVLQSHLRACLDATRDADELLREALGSKKLKELRRQRHRLAEHGPVNFELARSPGEVAAALELFLSLEASGWKARRGTALIQDEGDAGFIRRAVPALAEKRQCEIVTLRAGPTPVAAAVVLRHQDRAFYFKLGIDERFARFSPGVQLTLDLTRHLCADPAIATADSTAGADHSMINPIWRGRFAIGDVLIPLRRRDPVLPVITGALLLRGWMYKAGRLAVHAIRARRT
jgi:hypothetical protein